MARDEQRAMTSERLAAIRKRWSERDYGQLDVSGRYRNADWAGTWNYWIMNAPTDEGELLAEVERLRARENEPQPSPWPLGISTEAFIGGLKARIRELTDENNVLRAREAALLAVVRAVAEANHHRVGCGQSIIEYLDLPYVGAFQNAARALLASTDEAEAGEQTAQDED